MHDWKSDTELIELIKTHLYTPVVGDILDVLGFTHQFLPQPVQPLLPEMKLAGRAMPVLMIDVHGQQKKPFGKLTEALDQLQPGENRVRKEIENGMSSTAAFENHGIL